MDILNQSLWREPCGEQYTSITLAALARIIPLDRLLPPSGPRLLEHVERFCWSVKLDAHGS